MKKLLLAGFFVFACVVSANTLAAGFIKFGGIDGEATDKEHQGWIELDSYQWGMARPSSSAAGQSRRRGSVIVEDLTFEHELDTSSPRLAEVLAKGEVIPRVELHLHDDRSDRAGSDPYLAYRLINVVLTAYHIDWHSDDRPTSEDGQPSEKRPTEQISINFEEIEMTYVPDEGEPVVWSYDAEEGR